MSSDLYKIAILINDPKFNLIVKAGMLKYAQSIDLTAPLTVEKNFAVWVLKNPMATEISMIALVASDPAVLEAVPLSDGDYLDTAGVTDDAVSAAIASKWSIVATKYPTNKPY